MLSGNRIGTSFKGFIIGGAVGSVLTFLFTPKSGKDLRKDLESTSRDYMNKARSEGKKIVSEAKDIYNDILLKAEQLRALTTKYAENAYTVPARRIEHEIKSLRMALNAAISTYNRSNNRTVENDKRVKEIYSEFENESLPKFEGMGRRNNKN
jgi:gas vesicle protein